MSSSTNIRSTTQQSERKSATEASGKPRGAGSSLGGSKSERPDGQHPISPQPSTGTTAHRRMPSGLQKSGRAVEERRTERVQVTTRETLTSRTRSPDRRPVPSLVPEKSRATEAGRATTGESKPRLNKAETAQGMTPHREPISSKQSDDNSTMAPRSNTYSSYDCTPGFTSFCSTFGIRNTPGYPTEGPARAFTGVARSCNSGGFTLCLHGM